MNFVPLHVHSGYSFLASGLTIEKIVSINVNRDFPYVALSDTNGVFGWGELAKLTNNQTIKPLFGVDLIVDNQPLTFFVNNENGYRLISKLSPRLQVSNGLHVSDFVDIEDNLSVIFPAKSTVFAEFLEKDPTMAARYLREFAFAFPKLYLGLEINEESDLVYAEKVREFAKKYDYSLVAFPLILYATPEDALTLTIVNAIRNEDKISDKKATGPYYFLSEADLARFYSLSELALTKQIADAASFTFKQTRGQLLSFPLPPGLNATEYLLSLINENAKIRGIDIANEPVASRLAYELSVIDDMGYNDYFLLVADYVNFAKKQNILVGPGRGSAAGSLVSYLLGITEINPLDYDLLFERFLNPERQTMPDIDIDFEDDRRDEIIAYLRARYGHDRVANIITYITIGAKQALRDIGRIFNYPTRDIDMLSKSIGNLSLSLRDSYRKITTFRNLVDSDKYYLEIVTLAAKIEGLPRQTGMHAAGIILNDTPLTQSLPVIKSEDGFLLSQYEMGTLEEQGFLKMDILGLTNLSTIRKCFALIRENHGIELELSSLPFDQPEIYQLISSGHTMGLFQLETSGMQNAIARIKPSNFNDVVATLALFRPGPMQNIDVYVERKNNSQSYAHRVKSITPILSSTFGIIVYQEQIMQISQVMAGMSLAQADLFRRAISKKNLEQLNALKADFILGAQNKGYTSEDAQLVFEEILKFADYGFNKSHSVAYARLACQMAYLKAFYPAEFYAAILGVTNANNDTKFQATIAEIKARKISLLVPDINFSTTQFQVRERKLLFPLTAIKSISVLIAQQIEQIRKTGGPFSSFIDFVTRSISLISDKQLLALINAGCFDTIEPSRATLRNNMDKVLQYASILGVQTSQLLLTPTLLPPPLINPFEDQLAENLELEYEALGIMISDSLLSLYEEKIANNKIKSIKERMDLPPNSQVLVVGIVRNIKAIRTKKGQQMAFITIYDDNGELEITIFPELYAQVYTKLEKNAIIVVKGELQTRQKLNLLADTLKLLEEFS
ncbi:MAG: DNA polymerase III subunit alpha [Bacilli bacterium]